MKIGFFDSGLGGLAVLRQVVLDIPDYDYVFYGDTANLPYGEKSENEIYELLKSGISALFEEDCSIVIVACNTASVGALRKLQDEWLIKYFSDRKILGIVVPTIEEIVQLKPKKVCIIATKQTVESKRYSSEITKINNDILVEQYATSELVPFIENGDMFSAQNYIQSVILPWIEKEKPDLFILGCTHYSLLKDYIRQQVSVDVLSQDEIISSKLSDYLLRHSEIENTLSKNKGRKFIFSKTLPIYEGIINSWFK